MSIEKKISYLIEKDFPAYYREEGPVFVEFIKTYYEWLESTGQVNYHARNILDYKDIDTTVDDFIVYFKQKYLPNVQFDTATDVQQLVKHTLDLYRSKGTDRSIDLFFRLVYGKPAEIYYPGEDIFRLSDGKWVKPIYLEITSSPNNRAMINRQIVGLTSGATAFVERIIRRKIVSKYAEIMFISSVNGDFETGEKITVDGSFQEDSPTVLGSLTTLQVISGGQDFVVGEIVNLSSDNGVQGKGRVANVTNYTGLVDFEIADSGWGYTANAEVLVSEKVLTISEVDPTSNSTRPFVTFERIVQPIANISYDSANSSFAANDVLFSYYSNNVVAGSARVISSANSSATNGSVRVAVLSGEFGVFSERNVNATATVVVSKFSNSIYGVVHNSNASSFGTANAVLGRRYVTGTGTRFDRDLFVLQTNSVGNVDVSAGSNSVTGNATLFDIVMMKPSANLSGTVYINSTSLSVLGIGTSFNTNFLEGQYISVYTNSSVFQSRKIDTITNSTVLVVNSAFTVLNSAAQYAKSDLNPYISVWVNSTLTEARSVSMVVNSSFLTVQSHFTTTNSAARYANSYIREWISFTSGARKELRLVNNVINSTALWLKWPLEFSNSVAAVGNVTVSNTRFVVPFVNASGTAWFNAQSRAVIANSGANFTQFVNGDFIALYSNTTTYEIKTIETVTNSTYLLLSNVSARSNASGIFANVTANSSYYFGKRILLYSNSTTFTSATVTGVANDSQLYISVKPSFDNSAVIFSNTTVKTQFYKSGNTVVANAVSYTDLTATANVIGTKANVQLTVIDNAIRFANDTIVYQTNSTGFEVANARVISASYFGTNTFLVVNTVSGAFQPSTLLKAKTKTGTPTTANGTLANIQYSIGVIDIDNVFTTNTGNFVYTSSNTTGVVSRISQHNVLAGFSISSNSLSYSETVTFYSDPIEPYVGVYLNAETFQPPGMNLVSKIASANIDTSLFEAFTNSAITIGGINTLVAINPGTDYDTSPVVTIYEPLIGPANRRDYILQVSNSSGVFTVGEILTQNSATVGIVKYSNSTAVGVKRIRYETPFLLNLEIEGLASGATANIVLVDTDPNVPPIGLNSSIEANVVIASGSVTELDVVDSGAGYIDNETVAFISKDGIRSGQAVAKLGKQGQAEGYYASKGSFMSADKKIFDGMYYQEYSYEIRSPITLDKYENMLKNVLHIAGTKFFASVVTPTVANVQVDINQASSAITGRFVADTTLDSNVVLTSNTKILRANDLLSGIGIKSDTRITTINSTAFVMSNSASGTYVGTTVTYSR